MPTRISPANMAEAVSANVRFFIVVSFQGWGITGGECYPAASK